MWETEQPKIQKKNCENKNSKFEFEAPHTNILNINWNLLAKIHFYILL